MRRGSARSKCPARALYASHWEALSRALERDMPPGCAWTRPRGGFLAWVTLPANVDTVSLREAALRAGVAYVPGPPFHVGGARRNELRLSFSHLTEDELDLAAQRLAGVVRAATEPSTSTASSSWASAR